MDKVLCCSPQLQEGQAYTVLLPLGLCGREGLLWPSQSSATILIQQLLNTRSRGVIVYVCAYVSQTQRHLFDLALQGDGNIV